MVRLTRLLVVLVLAGCAGTLPPTLPDGTPATRPDAPPPPAPEPEPSVTLALQDQAEAARRGGDYDTAIRILERAIRIDPDSAELWLQLGQVNLEAGDARAAEQFGRKALQFAGTRADLEQRAYTLIDAAARAQRP